MNERIENIREIPMTGLLNNEYYYFGWNTASIIAWSPAAVNCQFCGGLLIFFSPVNGAQYSMSFPLRNQLP
jgi:hypothetical protein